MLFIRQNLSKFFVASYLVGFALLFMFLQHRVTSIAGTIDHLHEKATQNLWFVALIVVLASIGASLAKGIAGRVTFLAALAIPLVLTIWSTWFGRFQLSTYDASSIIDLAWRLKSGQSPGIDFSNTLPPLHLVLTKLSWSLWGYRWTSFTYMSMWSTIALGISSMIAWGFNTKKQSRLQLIILGSVIAVPHVVIGHLWHSSTSTLVAISAACWMLALVENELSRPTQIVLAIHLGLLIGAKPNIGLPMALILAIAGICILRRRLSSLFLMGSISFLTTAILVLASNIDMQNYVHTLSGLAQSRSTPNMLFPDGLDSYFHHRLISIYTGGVILLLIYAIMSMRNLSKMLITARYRTLIGFGSVLVSLFGMATNWDIKESSLSLMLFGFLVLASSQTKDMPQILRQVLTFLPLTIFSFWLLFSSFMLGASRWRMELTGPMFQRGVTNELTGGVLDEVRGSPLLQAVVNQVQNVLEIEKPGTVFFGPRMEFLYSQFKINSPQGLPIWWHEGTSYLAADEPSFRKTFTSLKFDILIFFKNDYTRIPISIMQIIASEYTADETHSQLTIFRKTNN